MEDDVTTTLNELERKLKELERELESVGRSGETDAEGPPPAPADIDAAADPLPPIAPGAADPVAIPAPVAPWDAVAAWHGTAPPAPDGEPPAPSSLQRQLDELVAFRDHLVASTNALVDELSRVLDQLGTELAESEPEPDPADTVLGGHVTVAAGPFGDLATLTAFEQALQAVPGVERADVRTLDAGHALIEVDLREPVALGAELRRTVAVPFAVTAAGEGHLALMLNPQ